MSELTSGTRQRLKELERENRELRAAVTISFAGASAYFAKAGVHDRLWKK